MDPRHATVSDPVDREHPTRRRLLDATIELLDAVPVDDVTLAAVLERSDVSSGSLYHHFDDLPDLVEQALIARWAETLRASGDGLRRLVGARDAADFRTRIEALLVVTLGTPPAIRLRRVEVFGAAASRPSLAAALAEGQQAITDELAGLFRTFQGRGWMRTDLDAAALATFVQAMVLGRVVDDIAERHVDPDDYAEVAVAAFRAIAFKA